jgi:peptide deformylase
MSHLTILEYPDPRLRTKAQPVAVFDTALQTLLDDMFETMYAAPIGSAIRSMFTSSCRSSTSEERNQPLVLINRAIAPGKRQPESTGRSVGARHLR